MKLDDKTYNILKWVCLIFIPALCTLLGVVLSIWNVLPAETIKNIITTLSAIATFMGALIGISTVQYNKED